MPIDKTKDAPADAPADASSDNTMMLQTPRLIVRPVVEDDLPALLAVNGDPNVTHHLPYAPWAGLDDARAWHQRMQGLAQTEGAIQRVIVHRQSRVAIGTVLLFRIDPIAARAELGYVMAQAHWRQGLTREAVRAVIDEAFGRLKLRRLEAQVNPSNHGSCALLEGLGFVCEGLLRKRWVKEGVPYDVRLYGLLSSDGRAGDEPSSASGTGAAMVRA